MLVTSSSSFTPLIARASNESLTHLYRTLLQQARLLASTFDDPVLYSSHRFLARKNLEPLLTTPPALLDQVPTWPPSTPAKRVARARVHRRQLADANFGWEHSVYRALSLAYARSGKLRRDALSDLSPQPATDPQELKYPKTLRSKVFSPVLQALLLNSSSMDGAPVKRAEHLTGRPPPPFLPSEDDVLVKYFGKAMGRKRVRNASKRFVKTYLRKIKLPLDAIVLQQGEQQAGPSMFAHLESKAFPPPKGVLNIPKRLLRPLASEKMEATETARNASSALAQVKFESKPYLAKARQQTELYRSDMNSSAHRKRSLRIHGWSSHPKDYSRARAQRRIYGRILDDTPLLLVDCSASNRPDSPEGEEALQQGSVANDPLGIRAKLRRAHQHAVSAGTRCKIRVVKSRYAVGPRSSSSGEQSGEGVMPRGLFAESERSRRNREDPSGWLTQSELDFLRSHRVL